MDYTSHSLNNVAFSLQDDPLTNLQTAFEVAEKHLDIPQMLDAQGNIFIISHSVSMLFLPCMCNNVLYCICGNDIYIAVNIILPTTTAYYSPKERERATNN